ncbi:hypothetical protein, partial [[Mycoplasma] anseris]
NEERVAKEEVITYLEKENLVDKPVSKVKEEEKLEEACCLEKSSACCEEKSESCCLDKSESCCEEKSEACCLEKSESCCEEKSEACCLEKSSACCEEKSEACCLDKCSKDKSSCCCGLNLNSQLVKFHIENIEEKTAYQIGAKDIEAELEGHEVEIIKVVPNNRALDVQYVVRKGQEQSAIAVQTLHGFKNEYETTVVTNDKVSNGFWALIVILILLIITNVVLITLRATSII